MTHHIVTAGLKGQAPDWEQGFGTISAARDGAAERFDLTESQAKRLRKNRWLPLDVDEHGAEYVHIQDCDCDDPWDHSDTETAADWIDST